MTWGNVAVETLAPILAADRARAIVRATSVCVLPWLAAAFLAACSANAPQTVASLPATQAQSAADKGPAEKGRQAKVALLVPLSAQGHSGLIGKSLKQAAELALFERDNPHLQLMVKDDKGTPDGAKAAAAEATSGGATLILGPLFAKSVSAVAPVARQANVPVVAFSNDLQVAGAGVYLLSFQPAPEVARIVNFAVAQGKRRFAALMSEDAFGKIAAASFKDAVSRAGGTIAALETYPASANGMLEPMRKISAAIRSAEAEGSPVDALFVPGAQENLETIARLLPQAEIDTETVKLIGTGGMDYPNAGRDARLIGAWYPGPDPQGWSEFSQRYAKSYGQAPPRITSLAYDGVSLAIALSGGPEDQRFTAGTLTRPRGFTGVDGAFRLLPNGGTDRALAILEVQKFGARVIERAPSLAPGPSSDSSSSALPAVLRSVLNLN
jgi:ABC-type branched-subunit amino acid transport system substrate-binding protein